MRWLTVSPYIVYTKEMTQSSGWLFQKDKNHVTVIKRIRLEPGDGSSLGREEGLEMEFGHMANDSIIHLYAIKPQPKLQLVWASFAG